MENCKEFFIETSDFLSADLHVDNNPHAVKSFKTLAILKF